MKVFEAGIKGVSIIEPAVFEDDRGYFMETYQRQIYIELGIDIDFVQDNVSFSKKGTLRGLHYQYPHEQAKLIQVLQGEIFDVAVDIRKESPEFGRWTSAILSDKNKRQLFVPKGFAHGLCVLSETAVVAYKCSDFYSPKSEGGILWSDPDLDIHWPIDDFIITKKDNEHPFLKDVPPDKLP